MKFIDEILTFHFKDDKMLVTFKHYHRAATGLRSGTTVYLYPRKTMYHFPSNNLGNKGGNQPNKQQVIDMREVIVSPFHPSSWADIWKLELSAKDRAGLVKEITRVLKEKKVNIFIQESLIANYDQNFSVLIIGDFEQYLNNVGVKTKWDLKKNDIEILRQQIEKDFKDNTEEEFGIEVVRFEPIKFLLNSSPEAMEVTKTNSVPNLEYYYQPARNQGVKIIDKGITIDTSILTHLGLREYANGSNTIQGTIFSDTEEKFIIIRFFKHDQLVINLEITHFNVVGAIEAFTEKIQEANPNFNILSCYNRIDDDQNTAHWYVIIDVTSDGYSIPRLIKHIEELTEIVMEVTVMSVSKNLLDKDIPGLDEMQKPSREKQERKKLIEDIFEIIKTFENTHNDVVVTQKEILHANESRFRKNKILICAVLGLIAVVSAVLILLYWSVMEPVMAAIGLWVAIGAFIITVITGVRFRFSDYAQKKLEEQEKKISDQAVYTGNSIKLLEENVIKLKDEVNKLESE